MEDTDKANNKDQRSDKNDEKMQGGILNTLKKTINFGADKIHQVVEQNKIEEKAQFVADKIIKNSKRMNEKAQSTETYKKVKSGLNKVAQSVKNQMSDVSDQIELWSKIQIEKNIRRNLDKMPNKIKKAFIDPAMFDFVKEGVNDVIDDIWPEIQEEIIINLKYSIDNVLPYEIKPYNPYCCFKPLSDLRAWYIYTIHPYDLTIWQQLRTFRWWCIFFLQLIPYYAIQPALFILEFLLMDRGDEFQLIQFILNFKTFQFISGGIINGNLGLISYYTCVNFINTNDAVISKHNCYSNGPGNGFDYQLEIISFLLKIALTWISAFYLFFSKPKGYPKFKYLKEDREAIQQRIDEKQGKNGSCLLCCSCLDLQKWKGGRLWWFIIYDFFAALISISYFLSCQNIQNPLYWQQNANIFFTQFIYGILLFPFMIFLFPGTQVIITKSRPTAYDRFGRCVPRYVSSQKYIKNYGKIDDDANITLQQKIELVQEEDEELIQVDSFKTVLYDEDDQT